MFANRLFVWAWCSAGRLPLGRWGIKRIRVVVARASGIPPSLAWGGPPPIKRVDPTHHGSPHKKGDPPGEVPPPLKGSPGTIPLYGSPPIKRVIRDMPQSRRPERPRSSRDHHSKPLGAICRSSASTFSAGATLKCHISGIPALPETRGIPDPPDPASSRTPRTPRIRPPSGPPGPSEYPGSEYPGSASVCPENPPPQGFLQNGQSGTYARDPCFWPQAC